MQTASDPELTAQLLAGGSVSGFPGPSQLDFPLVIGFPAECSEFSCGMRFLGASRSEELASFVVDSLMKLPQVLQALRITPTRNLQDQFWTGTDSPQTAADPFSQQRHSGAFCFKGCAAQGCHACLFQRLAWIPSATQSRR